MGTVYATWDDIVEAYEGTLPDSRKPWVEALLRRGSVRLRQMAPSIDSRLAIVDTTDPLWLDPELPAGLLIDAVLRVVRNPSGAQQQTAGPFNVAFAGGVQRAEVHFDAEEVAAQLTPPPDVAVGGSIQVGIPLQSTWVDGLPPYRWDPSRAPSGSWVPSTDVGLP